MDKATLAKAVGAAEVVVVEDCVMKTSLIEKAEYDEIVTQLLADPLTMPNKEIERAKARMIEIIGEIRRTEPVAAQRKLGQLLARAYGRHFFTLQLARLEEIITEWRGIMMTTAASSSKKEIKVLAQNLKHEVTMKAKWLDSLRKKSGLFEDADFNLKIIHRLRAEASLASVAVALRSVQDEAAILAKTSSLSKAELDTTLSTAAMNGHSAVLVLVLHLGASPNGGTQNGVGATPLTWAIQRNDIHAVRTLLEAGADPNFPGYRGYLPHLYAQLYAPDCLPLLIEKGCDARRPERQFQAAIHRNEPPSGYSFSHSAS